MAKRMKAIQAYSPRVKISRQVQRDEVIRYIAGRTGLNEGTLLLVMMELRDCIAYYAGTGCSIKLEGLGTFSPTVNRDGDFGINHRPDRWLVNQLNAAGGFLGELRNKDMIGKTAADFVARWDAEHPEDPVNESP